MTDADFQIVSYDEQEGRLQVVLPGGARVDYFEIPRSLYENLVASQSPLETFNAKIWNQGFEHRRYWANVEHLLKYLEDNFYFEPPTVTLSSRSPGDDTPRHFACVWGDVGAVEILLEAGAEVDASGDLGCTPLYESAYRGFVRCTARLLQAGASADASNELNSTPRAAALQSGNPKLVALFSTRTSR